MDHSVSSFLSGWAAAPEALFAAKQVDEFAEQDQPNSSFFILYKGAWGKYPTNVAWPAIAMATAQLSGEKRFVVAISPYGDYWEVEPSGRVEATGKIKAKALQLRSLGIIEDVAFACGMGRVVLRRNGTGQWTIMGPPAPPDSDDSVIGFEDIAGYSLSELYAVGWQGEIWHLDQKTWRRVDSPVTELLNAVCCAPDGHVYVVGNNGVMLRGRRDVWKVLETGREENLMDVCYYGGALYVVSDFRVFRLEGTALVDDTDFADLDDVPATCLYLLDSPDELYSMGPKDLFQRDGAPWQRVV